MCHSFNRIALNITGLKFVMLSIYTVFGCYELGKELGIQEFGPEFHCLEWQGNENWNLDPIPRSPPVAVR
jgi:hypothetical protein